jgi:hypothetical protein
MSEVISLQERLAEVEFAAAKSLSSTAKEVGYGNRQRTRIKRAERR